jgi:sulfate permease, SulP family
MEVPATREQGASAPGFLPIVNWLPGYQRRWLRSDVVAGLTVWAVLVPEGMAYASLARMPAETGLYAAILPLVLYAVFGSSRQLSVGPSSTVAILSATTVAGVAAGGDERQYVTLSAFLAILVGAILILAGLARLGFMSDFLSRPVLDGFIVGAALVIAIGQVPKLLGIEIAGGNFFEDAADILGHLGETKAATLILGGGLLTLNLVLHRVVPKLPAALLVLVLGIGFVSVFDLNQTRDVAIVGEIPVGLPSLGWPEGVSWNQFAVLVPGALGLALVAFADSIGAARSFAARHGYETDGNQELVGIGAANLAAGFSGAFTVDGSLSRTAAADGAGARTQLSSLACAVLIVITVLALTPLFKNLPEAALAAIVIAAIWHLVDLRRVSRLWSLDRTSFWAALLAMAGVLVFGVLEGVLIAVGFSLVALIYRATRPQVALLGKSGARYYALDRRPDAETAPGVLVVRFDYELFFANASFFREEIRHFVREAGQGLHAAVLDCEGISEVDLTAAEVMVELDEELGRQGITVLLARVKGPIRDMIRRMRRGRGVEMPDRYQNVAEAVDAARDLGRETKGAGAHD